MPLIREETAGDYEAVRAVNRLAFGGDEEAALADRLRADRHILFGELPVQGNCGAISAVSLAPMAVRPDWQWKLSLSAFCFLKGDVEMIAAAGVEEIVEPEALWKEDGIRSYNEVPSGACGRAGVRNPT